MLITRHRGKLFAGALVAASAALLAVGLCGQEAAAPPAERPIGPATQHRFVGAQVCRECHVKKGDAVVDESKPFLIEQDQSTIWEQHDLHSRAYAALTGERGKQMTGLLQIDVTKDKQCLACHAVLAAESDLSTGLTAPKLAEQGVTCEACHGRASQWLQPHFVERAAWRFDLDRQAKAGMEDVYDPVRRAQLCASCHVGNFEQGKVITHAMYAAGHPPLGNFEAESFAANMPRHWQLHRDRPLVATLRAKQGGDLSLGEARMLRYAGDKHAARVALVGAAVTLAESLKLLAAEAKAGFQPESRWPELARFECAACHHDLKADLVQIAAREGRRPGRPRMPLWPMVLMEPVLEVEGRNKEIGAAGKDLAESLRQLDQSLGRRVFGSPDDLVRHSQKAANAAEQCAALLEREEYDSVMASSVLGGLCRSARRVNDYDSARQIVGAIRAIWRECTEPTIPDQFKLDDSKRKVVDDELAKLAERLFLDRPPGNRATLVDGLPKALDKRSGFDAQRYQESFRRIAAALDKMESGSSNAP